jgi:hypothetical protein
MTRGKVNGHTDSSDTWLIHSTVLRTGYDLIILILTGLCGKHCCLFVNEASEV